MTKTINNLAELDADLRGIGDALESLPLDEPLGEARAIILQAHRDNFTSSAGPNGEAWPPRKRAGDGHPLLMDTGALLQAATGGAGHVSRIEPRELAVGVDLDTNQGGIPGARAHQFGYPPNNLPARPWLGPRMEQLDDIEDIIGDFVGQNL